ncbi:hypothetical protein D3C84_680390 [compost metagenome]
MAQAIDVVPVVTLHLAISFGDHHATQAVARRGITTDKAVAVAVDTAALMGAQGGAIGVLDPAVGGECCGFAGQRLLDRLLRRNVPFVEQIKVRQVPGHQGSIGQARVFVFGSVFGDGQCSGDGFANRFGATGRGTGRAFALTGIQGDAKALVTVELDRFDFALTH